MKQKQQANHQNRTTQLPVPNRGPRRRSRGARLAASQPAPVGPQRLQKVLYIHDEIGYNYRLVNVAAAMGVAQMELLPEFIKRKKEIIRYYKQALAGVGDIGFQQVAEDVNPNWWPPTIKTSRQRELLKILNDNKMQSRPFWVPMNQLRMFRDNIYFHKNDRSDFVYRHCLSIPCSTNITDGQLEAVSKTIREIF